MWTEIKLKQGEDDSTFWKGLAVLLGLLVFAVLGLAAYKRLAAPRGRAA
jgi:hypothetical protein